jgi:hypothetical protein
MTVLMVALVALTVPALAVACGGLLPAPRRAPAPAVPVGRHARRWPPVAAMLDTGEIALAYGGEYPSAWSLAEDTIPLRRVTA